MQINLEIDKACTYLEEALKRRALKVAELTATPNLNDAIEEWVETRAEVERLKGIKAQADRLLDYLTDDRIPWQLDKHNTEFGLKEDAYLPHALGRVEIRHHVKASINQDMKPEAYKWLRAHDLGGLIIETIPHQSLGATAKDFLAEGKDLPADLFTTSVRRYAAFVQEKTNANSQKEPIRQAARRARAGA